MDILKQISEAQNDHEKIEEIIKRFNPLLKKYARKLNYEALPDVRGRQNQILKTKTARKKNKQKKARKPSSLLKIKLSQIHL